MVYVVTIVVPKVNKKKQKDTILEPRSKQLNHILYPFNSPPPDSFKPNIIPIQLPPPHLRFILRLIYKKTSSQTDF
jgi:hypothetical protein